MSHVGDALIDKLSLSLLMCLIVVFGNISPNRECHTQNHFIVTNDQTESQNQAQLVRLYKHNPVKSYAIISNPK